MLPENINKEIVDNALFYNIRGILNNARQKVFSAVNATMIEAYWNIGRLIVEKQGGEERAAYGDGLMQGFQNSWETNMEKVLL